MGFGVAQMTTRQEMSAIQEALDSRNITTDPFCGAGDIAGRVEWVLRRNDVLEARCKEWAEKYNAAMALAEMEKKTKIERGEMVVELRTALEFYATAENYRLNGYPDGDRPIWADYGSKARAALGYSPNTTVSRGGA